METTVRQTEKIHPYDYVGGNPCLHLRLVRKSSWGAHHVVAFHTRHATQYHENNIAYGEYFLPESGAPFPLLILLHALGDASLIPCRALARDLAKRGTACFLLYLPCHSRRTPKVFKEAEIMPLSAAQYLELFETAVADVRTVIDWAQQQADIESRRVAIAGISMGGFVAAIAMGVDKRLSAGVLMLTGGNLEQITWNSRSKSVRRMHSGANGQHRQECHRIYAQYPRYLDEVRRSGFENVIPPKECFLFDPITFSHYLRGRPLLMVNALWDGIVPKRSVLELWKECGKPPIIWLPTTHLGFFLWYPMVKRRLARFLHQCFSL